MRHTEVADYFNRITDKQFLKSFYSKDIEVVLANIGWMLISNLQFSQIVRISCCENDMK